ncbi:MAG: PIN domain-containing protein [Proteobacteria bacterium]|nr:PIN domain-containing protein [Pseudomonadota bacterium]MBU1709251.1 PIN domain-containing protein [Pseudomonadota bacterium]
MIYLDTHVVVWLYAGETGLFPEKVKDAIEENDLLISPIVLLELQYLNEIGRLNVPPTLIFENLASCIGLKSCDLSLMQLISEAILQTWTRDPFDRMITAAAVARNVHLITKDQLILEKYPKALWG